MIGIGLKKLATENGLTIENGMAYGYLKDCLVTLTEGAGYKRMSIYVGTQCESEDGTDATTERAKQIAEMIAEASGDGNVYRLLTGKPNMSPLVVNHGGSVVTINFFDNPGTMDCIIKFVDEVLPQVAPLTRRECLCCREDGDVVPVMLSADTVVPMHNTCMNGVVTAAEDKLSEGNILTGAVGALLGSILGAVVWAVLYVVGYMASIVGMLIGFLAGKGYDLMKGKQGVAKVVIVLLCVVVAVFLGNCGGYLWEIHQQYVEEAAMYAKFLGGAKLNEIEYIKDFIPLLLDNPDFTSAAMKDMGMGLLFGLLGASVVLRGGQGSTAAAKDKPKALNGSL